MADFGDHMVVVGSHDCREGLEGLRHNLEVELGMRIGHSQEVVEDSCVVVDNLSRTVADSGP